MIDYEEEMSIIVKVVVKEISIVVIEKQDDENWQVITKKVLLISV